MPKSAPTPLQPLLTPQAHLRLVANTEADTAPLPAEINERLAAAFTAGSGHGLLQLGAAEVGTVLPPAFARWPDFAARYGQIACCSAEGDDQEVVLFRGRRFLPAVEMTAWAAVDSVACHPDRRKCRAERSEGSFAVSRWPNRIIAVPSYFIRRACRSREHRLKCV